MKSIKGFVIVPILLVAAAVVAIGAVTYEVVQNHAIPAVKSAVLK